MPERNYAAAVSQGVLWVKVAAGTRASPQALPKHWGPRTPRLYPQAPFGRPWAGQRG